MIVSMEVSKISIPSPNNPPSIMDSGTGGVERESSWGNECGYCQKRLNHGSTTYLYRDRTYCSEGCRANHMTPCSSASSDGNSVEWLLPQFKPEKKCSIENERQKAICLSPGGAGGRSPRRHQYAHTGQGDGYSSHYRRTTRWKKGGGDSASKNKNNRSSNWKKSASSFVRSPSTEFLSKYIATGVTGRKYMAGTKRMVHETATCSQMACAIV
mmetsp:Transcript_3549/g.6620  ORF Transcript_3549/g.6620 Transcript_3549/m.6620 type:complete len:213 (-) Transcript_3549:153-791(-)|eukprot:CAMPEP_0197542182 /NCGR_PEP_ID=MMETSP1318-20131121/67568_1 /TAXON_ID=552666 /ORGANISM="Partenskyella glossopodia, Strain RCC365" /LENGTH=212 /DNA_ID=CAMNT_0043101429 /DNA_START=203 /DNA_END=841 /DNA_ORIENTATION=+